MTDQESFEKRFEALREEGLVDIKFCVADSSLSDKDLIREALLMEDAIKKSDKTTAWSHDVEPHAPSF